MESSARSHPKAQRFPALSVPHFRFYAATALLSMAADNIEHVIGYWVIWQLTHSPFWLGYAVVAHWLPFTLFSFYSGSLADRVDCRRLIQISQGLYILVSFGWGLLYLTGQLQIWHIAILLIFHGLAGLIFGPSSMLIIHEMVGEEKLVSAISLNAALRPLATTIGPAIGGLLMATVGPGWGFFVNMFIYLPLSVTILFFPYRGATARKRSEGGWSFILEGLRVVRQSPTIVAMLAVVAATSLLLGNAFQVLMPAFAQRLGVSSTGYSILLSASGMGAILGGLLLGWIGTTRLRPIMVTAGVITWSVLLTFFALSNVYMVSLVLLCMVGIMQIVFVSMSQSIVQAWAPQAVRGRVIGVYHFAAHGMRVLSGFVLGSLATLIGPPQALLLLAGLIGIVVLGISTVIRSLWHSEMKEEALPAGKATAAATGP
ncbi:MAG: MFS transporter [Candidatus Binatia bacterium]